MLQVGRWLRIRPGEGRTAWRLVALMILVLAGAAVGSTGIESLLFARFGPQVLPTLYIAVGPVTLAAMVVMSAVLGRIGPARVLTVAPLALAAVLAPARIVLLFDPRWFYPVLWLVMMAVWTIEAMVLWGVAGLVHDTRQAKRLFPLYGAGMVLGGVIGGLVTKPLASTLHAESLILIWAAALVGGSLLTGTVIGRPRAVLRLKRKAFRRSSVLQEMVEGLRFLRGSALLRSMAGALALLSLLYFTLTLPFAQAVTARYADPDALAGFLGVFFGLMNGAALLLSLVLANRLFARFGVATLVVALPAIYLLGFTALGVHETFGLLVGFRFLQMAWVNGVWAAGWQALFNVVPAERRGQVRTFMDGGPLQAGTVGAGLLLLAAQRLLSGRQLFLIGAAIAATALVITWRARQAYRQTVVEALRAGWPDVFAVEEEPFGGALRDASALRTLVRGAKNPDPRLRRVALEILSQVESPEAAAALVSAARDPDPEARAIVLKALARRRIPALIDEIAPSARDPDPLVRGWAVRAMAVCRADPLTLGRHLEERLADPDPTVRARAAATLVAKAGDPDVAIPTEIAEDGRRALDAMASDPRPEWRAAALDSLETGDPVEPTLATGGLGDPDPVVRRAAASALGRLGLAGTVDPLIRSLGDDDPAVREAAAEALGGMPVDVGPSVADALGDPRLEAGALHAIGLLPTTPDRSLRDYAGRQAELARSYHDLWSGLGSPREGGEDLLAASLRHQAVGHALNALRALASVGDREAIDLVVENLTSRDSHQVANALEALETARDHEIARPLLALWETTSTGKLDPGEVVQRALADGDEWVRASAAMAARSMDGSAIRSRLETLSRSDPSLLVRGAIEWALRGDQAMETVSTLPVMERVLFLRRVGLFSSLSPPDLKHVAEATVERVYPDGAAVAVAGEPGTEMHLVVSGEIRVVMDQDDRSEEIAVRRAGEHVGEMAIITDEPRMASLVAAGTVRTLSLDQRRFQRILRERPEAALAVMRALCDRLRAAERQGPDGRPAERSGGRPAAPTGNHVRDFGA